MRWLFAFLLVLFLGGEVKAQYQGQPYHVNWSASTGRYYTTPVSIDYYLARGYSVGAGVLWQNGQPLVNGSPVYVPSYYQHPQGSNYYYSSGYAQSVRHYGGSVRHYGGRGTSYGSGLPVGHRIVRYGGGANWRPRP